MSREREAEDERKLLADVSAFERNHVSYVLHIVLHMAGSGISGRGPHLLLHTLKTTKTSGQSNL